MGWFDEQIRQRKENDNEVFEDAFKEIAGAVMGKNLNKAYAEKEIAQSAIDQILKFYLIKPKNSEIPAAIKTLDEQLEYRMRPYGIMRRTVKLDKGWYHCAVGPMLAAMKEDNRAVALIPGKFGGYIIVDTRTGKRMRLTRRTAAMIGEEAICFYKPLPMKPLKIVDLIKYALMQYSISDVLMILLCMGGVSGIGLLSPIFQQLLFGPILESGSLRVLLSLTSFMICFTAAQLLIFAFQTLINGRVSEKQNISVQAAVMMRVLSLPPAFFKQYGAGELSQRAQYVNSLCTTLMQMIFNTGLTSLFSLIYVAQIFAFAPALVLPAIIVLLITIGFSILSTLLQMNSSKKQMELSSKESGMTYAMITGIQKIKLAGAEKRAFARWAKLYAKQARITYNPPMLIKINSAISLAISVGGTLAMYFFAMQSGVSVSNYFAFNSAYGMVSGAFFSMVSIAISIANIKPILDMAKPILEAEPEVAEGKEVVTSINGNIEINNLSFRYSDTMPLVIDNLSLKIKSGEYIAIVGTTGCGKSTLLRLMLGFETPQKGAVYYDKKELSRVDLKSLRRKIGVVMQDGKLFQGDIYSNIIISAPTLTLSEAWEAAEVAAIADDIREMPMGMNTIISEGSGGISGGQRQRLMIARAVASKPKILFFDEATSALDNVTQKKVSEAIDTMKCTRVVIAHRLSTIRHCDRIIVMDQGKIVEDGTYDQLVEKNGLFAELVARQRLDVETE